MKKILLCEPNISEGRDRTVIEQVADAVRSVPGVRLIDYSSDPDHNRSVFSYVGEPEAVLEATKRLAAKAFELIDMRRHKGSHPRQGAVDVAGFIPVRGVETGEAVEIALAGKPGIAADMAVAGMLQVPRREALLLLAGLARMLAQPYLAGRLQVRGDATGLELHVLADATASAPATDPGRADTTTGSALLDRLALRLGWTVAFRPDGSIRVDAGPAG